MHHSTPLAIVLALLLAAPAPARQTTAGEWEADHTMRLGEHAYIDGDVHRALSNFRSAAAKDPRRADAHWRIAHCLVALRRLNEAQKELERARALAPEDPRILNTLAVVEMRRGNVETAVRVAEEAVTHASGVADVWDTLGWAALRAGNRQRARFAFERALKLDPSNKSSRRGLRLLGR